MNEHRATCEACHRERPTHELELVTVKDGRGEDQATLLLACKDTPTCAERIGYRVKVANATRNK